jgi:hypothetical protein
MALAVVRKIPLKLLSATEVFCPDDLVPEERDGSGHRIAEPLVAADDGTDEDAHEAPSPQESSGER